MDSRGTAFAGRHADVLWDAANSRCLACAHRCWIPSGGVGACGVRFHHGAALAVPWGYVSCVQTEPIEKKPFFHAWPGALTLSFGMVGCSMRCDYCQNWSLAQAPHLDQQAPLRYCTSPQELAEHAQELGATAVIATYNEPLITAEWCREIFLAARAIGLRTGMVSNGYATPEVLEYLRPSLDVIKVDLKCFSEDKYHHLGARLSDVTDSIRRIRALGLWLEVVTLIVPGFNDTDDELRNAARFLADVDVTIPWHLTPFHRDWMRMDGESAGPEHLLRGVELAREEGILYIYAGNSPGRVGLWESTRCHFCGIVLIERRGYRTLANHLSADGRCPNCGVIVNGQWK